MELGWGGGVFLNIDTLPKALLLLLLKKNNKKFSEYNDPTFEFEPNDQSSVYIFQNHLFTRFLNPIITNKEREMTIKCTRYSYFFLLYIYIYILIIL